MEHPRDSDKESLLESGSSLQDGLLPVDRLESKDGERTSSLDAGPWWCTRRAQFTALLLAVVLVAIALLGLFVVIPDMVQDSVDKATFDVGDLNMTDPTTDSVLLTTEATITLDESQPVDCKLESGDVDFKFQDPQLGWLKIGQLAMKSVLVDANTKSTSVLLQNMRLKVTEPGAWRRFNQAVVHSEYVTWKISGHVQARVTLLGSMQLFVPGVRLSKQVKQKGMNGLQGTQVKTFDATTTSQDKYPTQVASLYIHNPSPVAIMPLGVLTAKVSWKGVTMGWAKTGNVSMYRGMNTLNFQGPLAPDNVTMLSQLMSRFLGGEHSDVVITITNFTFDGTDPAWPDWKPFSPSCSTPLYDTALSGTQIPFVLSYPGGRVNITTESITDTDAKYLHVFRTSYLPLWFGIYNPFSAVEYVVAAEMDIIHNGVTFATVSEPNLSIKLKPKGYTLSGTDLASSSTLISPPSDTATAVVEELDRGAGYTYVATRGVFTMTVGCLTLELESEQSQNIPSCALTQYAQVHQDGGVCNRPNSSVIVAT